MKEPLEMAQRFREPFTLWGWFFAEWMTVLYV
jgi:hypothetical protein